MGGVGGGKCQNLALQVWLQSEETSDEGRGCVDDTS